MTQGTALEVRRESPADLIPMINIEAEQARLQNFRQFVHTALDKDKGHFGVIPGTKKNSLLQPGAEIIYRALECRPQFTLLESEKDWDRDFAYFLVKCEVVSVTTGIVIGEATGACSTLEKAADCPSRRALKGPNDDLIIQCAEHGTKLGRRAFEWGRAKGEKVWYLGCPDKQAAPLARTLQTVQAIANKRAMVAAIRTVGCVSEMFSQDDELWDKPQGGGEKAPPPMQPAQRPPTPRATTAKPPAQTRPKPGEGPSLKERLESAGEPPPDEDAGGFSDGDVVDGEFSEQPELTADELLRGVQASLGGLGVDVGRNLSWLDVKGALNLDGNSPAQIKASFLNRWETRVLFEGMDLDGIVATVVTAVKEHVGSQQ